MMWECLGHFIFMILVICFRVYSLSLFSFFIFHFSFFYLIDDFWIFCRAYGIVITRMVAVCVSTGSWKFKSYEFYDRTHLHDINWYWKMKDVRVLYSCIRHVLHLFLNISDCYVVQTTSAALVHSKSFDAHLIFPLIYPYFFICIFFFVSLKSDKSSYSGNFQGGKRSGKGSMMTADDVVHTGIWDNDCLIDEMNER